MTRKEMREYGYNLLRDTLGSSHLCDDDDLFNTILGEGCQETADRLPPEVTRVLKKSKPINLEEGVSQYAIEGAAFGITDFGVESDVQVSDGAKLRSCHRIDEQDADSDNPYVASTKYSPGCWIGPDPDDATRHAVNIRPLPSGAVENGLKLFWVATANVLTTDTAVFVIPPRFHKLPVWYAVAILLAKERDADSMRFWQMWKDVLIAENAKYGRTIEATRPGTQGAA